MGKAIIYNNPSGDKALENVYKKLQQNPKALDSSGMGERRQIETLHLNLTKRKKNTTDVAQESKNVV